MSHSTPPELQVIITLQSIWIEQSGIKQYHEAAWDKCIPAKFSLSRDKEILDACSKDKEQYLHPRGLVSVIAVCRSFASWATKCIQFEPVQS